MLKNMFKIIFILFIFTSTVFCVDVNMLKQKAAGITDQEINSSISQYSQLQKENNTDAKNSTDNFTNGEYPTLNKVKTNEDSDTNSSKAEIRSSIEKSFPAELKQFGYDTFSNARISLSPMQNISVGSDYILGPGDELNIYLWGNIQQNFTVNVDNDGTILIPKAGKVMVANQSLSDAKRIITRVMENNFANFTLDITLGKIRNIEVFVLGEAVLPGRYNLSALSTILYALYAAGGPTKIGTMRNVQLIRDKKVYKILDLYDLLLFGDKSDDISLKRGDTVYIPKIGEVVGIKGEVKVPAIYEIKDKSSLYNLYSMAGKNTRYTYIKELNIVRRDTDKDEFRLQTLTYKSIEEFTANSKKFDLDNGDIIEVKALSDKIENWVVVSGEVKYPGLYDYSKNNTLGELLNISGGLTPFGYSKRIEILRVTDNKESIIAVDISVENPNNTKLLMFDKIMVYDTNKISTTFNVKIEGEVNTPGIYPYKVNMTVADLIFKAGQLTPFADKEHVVVLKTLSPSINKIIELDNNDNLKYALSENDTVFIHKTTNLESWGVVELKGEVNYPGKYPLYKDETLTQIIKRAGGIKNDVNFEGIAIYRKSVINQKILNSYSTIQEKNQEKNTDYSFSPYLTDFNRLRVNFYKLFSSNDLEEDIVLQNEDIINIPKKSVDVTVIGGVNNQGTYLYKEHHNLGYYINVCGAYKKDADIGETYIVHIDGTVTKVNDNNYAIRAGDLIVVPTHELKDFDLIKTLLDSTQIIFNLTAVWKIIFQ